MRYSAVILAAGSGTRVGLGYNKLLYKIDEETIIEKTVKVFEQDASCSEIILVISKNDEKDMRSLFGNRVQFVFGGATRQESSYHGVSAAHEDIVMIHDGARPYVSQDELNRCKKAMESYDAALLMVPLKDTIKVVKQDVVDHTPERSTLMAALTPQCFKKDLICECLKKAINSQDVFSDDASVVERLSNTKVHVVMGEYTNIKITRKEDL